MQNQSSINTNNNMNPIYRQFQPSDKEPVTEFLKSLYRKDPEK